MEKPAIMLATIRRLKLSAAHNERARIFYPSCDAEALREFVKLKIRELDSTLQTFRASMPQGDTNVAAVNSIMASLGCNDYIL